MYSSSAFTSEAHFSFGRHGLKCRHKKEHRADIGWKCDETVKSGYGRRSSKSEGGTW